MQRISMSRLYANEIGSCNYSYGGFLLLNIVFIRNSFIPGLYTVEKKCSGLLGPTGNRQTSKTST